MKKIIRYAAITAVVAGAIWAGVFIYQVYKAQTVLDEVNERLANQAVDGTIIMNKELRDAYNKHYILTHQKK